MRQAAVWQIDECDMKWRAIWPLALVVLGLGAIGLGMARRETGAQPSGLLGQIAPAIAVASLDDAGASIDNAALAGRPVLVNFFASWCAPCRVEHPALMALAGEGVEIIGIAFKDEASAAQGFLAELGDPFVLRGQDPNGDAAIQLGVRGVPETFVLSADGRIVAHWPGPLDATAIDRVIRPALRSGAPAGN